MTNIQGSVQACPPRHARGTHKPLSSAQSRAQECESPLDVSPSIRSRVQEVPEGSQRNSFVATPVQTTSMTPSTTTGTQSEPQGSPFHSPRSSVTNWVRGEKSEMR